MLFTKADLNNLYIEEQNTIRKNSIYKIVKHMTDNVIEKAKKGQTCFSEYFPTNKLSSIQDNIIEELVRKFPDSKISYNDKNIESIKMTEIIIDWS